jgi:hypothetical protein
MGYSRRERPKSQIVETQQEWLSGCLVGQRDQSRQVKICLNRKQIFLGRFKALDAAIKVRRAAERELYGEYTRSA